MPRRIISRSTSSETPPLVFPTYYLWWPRRHWDDSLGLEYTTSAAANGYPLPALYSDTPPDTDINNTLSIATNPQTGNPFSGVTQHDVSQGFAYSQDQGTTIEDDMDLMYSIGCRGTIIAWQNRTVPEYVNRMDRVIDKTDVMVGQGKKFHVILQFEGEGERPASSVIADMNFYLDTHGSRRSVWRFRGKPIIIWNGSWAYPEATMDAVSQAVRDRAWLLGAQQWNRWPTQNYKNGTEVFDCTPYFDGNAYYWSGQDPYRNPASYNQLKGMADSIHSQGKIYGAPLVAGYDGRLLYGGTFHVIRKNGETLQRNWDGNMRGNPEFWNVITWNEIREGSHIVPLKRWGTMNIDVLEQLIAGNPARLY